MAEKHLLEDPLTRLLLHQPYIIPSSGNATSAFELLENRTYRRYA